MNFVQEQFYHIYNRGNNRQKIFLEEKNYDHFLKMFQKFVFPRCGLLAWCLMPNHFHFLVYTTEPSCATLDRANLSVQYLTEGIRLALSTYTKGMNSLYNRTGNLFQQKTKAKILEDERYPLTVFNYIHYNPVMASLAKEAKDWPYSSYHEYAGNPGYSFCDQNIAEKMLDVSRDSFMRIHLENRRHDERGIF